MRFQRGDIVRVKEGCQSNDVHFNHEMRVHEGKTYVISHASSRYCSLSRAPGSTDDGGGWSWSYDWLEPAPIEYFGEELFEL